MNPAPTHHIISRKAVLGVLGTFVLFALTIGYSEYKGHALVQEMASTTRSMSFRITDAENKNTELMSRLSQVENLYINQQSKSAQLDEQIGKVNNTVSTLDRLSKTDPQLLVKYSKVYFLNENYIPSKLSYINTEYLYNSSRPLQIHSDVLPFLQRMIEVAKYDQMNLRVLSAYRSFKQQEQLKTTYKVTYGSTAANTFSADQGYSEHQLGTTVDFSTSANGDNLNKFESSPEFTWLKNNAYRYGFILSYPPNNKYYVYEPWHWRFVGVDLAAKLHNEGKYFYDLDQRDISNYLVNMFQ
jgi:LAS superfamily LD-carboxypeptidase LdcB